MEAFHIFYHNKLDGAINVIELSTVWIWNLVSAKTLYLVFI